MDHPLPSPSSTSAVALADPVEVVTAHTPAHWRAVADLLHEDLTWLAATIGVRDIREVQPKAGRELADPRAVHGRDGASMFLALVDAVPAGIVGLHPLGPGVDEVVRMYVRPAARGHGVGERLLQALLATSRDRGSTGVVLETAPELMPAAVRLYEREGFRRTAPYSLFRADVVGMRLDLVDTAAA